MSFLRFLMLLSLIVWLGGVIFFASVLAPTVFRFLPTHQLAGNVVSRSLNILHWIAIISGVTFLVSSMIVSRFTTGEAHPFAFRHVLLYLMLMLTLISQFGISPKMAELRSSMGDIDLVSPADPMRVRFNALHVWSTRLESGVLLLGLVAVYSMARSIP